MTGARGEVFPSAVTRFDGGGGCSGFRCKSKTFRVSPSPGNIPGETPTAIPKGESACMSLRGDFVPCYAGFPDGWFRAWADWRQG